MRCINCNISGISDFVFNINSYDQNDSAKLLKGRIFLAQSMLGSIKHKLESLFELKNTVVISSDGCSFTILVEDKKGIEKEFNDFADVIEEFFFEEYNAEIYPALILTKPYSQKDLSENMGKIQSDINTLTAHKKRRKFYNIIKKSRFVIKKSFRNGLCRLCEKNPVESGICSLCNTAMEYGARQDALSSLDLKNKYLLLISSEDIRESLNSEAKLEDLIKEFPSMYPVLTGEGRIVLIGSIDDVINFSLVLHKSSINYAGVHKISDNSTLRSVYRQTENAVLKSKRLLKVKSNDGAITVFDFTLKWNDLESAKELSDLVYKTVSDKKISKSFWYKYYNCWQATERINGNDHFSSRDILGAAGISSEINRCIELKEVFRQNKILNMDKLCRKDDETYKIMLAGLRYGISRVEEKRKSGGIYD